jgi:hypothetical protein
VSAGESSLRDYRQGAGLAAQTAKENMQFVKLLLLLVPILLVLLFDLVCGSPSPF